MSPQHVQRLQERRKLDREDNLAVADVAVVIESVNGDGDLRRMQQRDSRAESGYFSL